MPGYDDKTIEKNIAEHNEIYKSGVTPTRKDIRWTSAEARQRDKDMKQFCKSSGESGTDPYVITTDAYREGWDRIFGHKTRPWPACCTAPKPDPEFSLVCLNCGWPQTHLNIFRPPPGLQPNAG